MSDEKVYKEVNILLVEDDDVDAMGVERSFKKMRIANPIVRAHDGIEGLSLLRKNKAMGKPCIILLDLNMPRMGGLEMLTALRNDDDISMTVVFILTTSKAEEDILSAYKKHVAGYIVKANAGSGFLNVVEMLDHYSRIIELPVY